MLSNILLSMRETAGKTQEEIAHFLNVQRQTYSRYENGVSKPDYEILKKIADFYDISTDYLLERKIKNKFSFEEKRLINLYSNASEYAKKIALFALENSSKKDNFDIKSENIKTKATIFTIDYYAAYPVSAGCGTYMEDVQKETLQLKKAPPSGACFVNRIVGDSMETMYFDGDKVFVAPGSVNKGEIGIFIYESEALIKQAGEMELISINPKYKNIPIKNPESLFCVGKVLGKCDDTYL